MAAPVGRWRATYTPGEWIVLAGPTSVVVLQPASGKHSALISALWEEVLSSASITELASRLAQHRIDTMPSFGAFFWAEDGMRSLVRGGIEVVDVATDSVVASGEGIQTWTETGLDGVTQVRITLPPTGSMSSFAAGGGPVLELPLVVGAVRAASVLLDGSPAAQVSSPQGQSSSPSASAGSVEADQPAAAPDAADRADEAADANGDGDHEGADSGGPGQEDPSSAMDGPLTEPMTEPFPLSVPVLPVPGVEPEPPRAGGEAPAAQLGPESDDSIEYGDTELLAPMPADDSMENGDTQLIAPVSPDQPPAGAMSPDSLIMAVVCQYGHASPQNAAVCRICGTPIVPQGPQLIPRPVLALLRASNGVTEEVDRVVLVGRAPAANASTARSPRLMTVISPGHDISRTHVEVAPEGWQVVVTDLRSTNGTTLVPPGSGERAQLPPGEPVPVPLGSVLELGDGVSVLIDFPQ